VVCYEQSALKGNRCEQLPGSGTFWHHCFGTPISCWNVSVPSCFGAEVTSVCNQNG